MSLFIDYFSFFFLYGSQTVQKYVLLGLRVIVRKILEMESRIIPRRFQLAFRRDEYCTDYLPEVTVAGTSFTTLRDHLIRRVVTRTLYHVTAMLWYHIKHQLKCAQYCDVIGYHDNIKALQKQPIFRVYFLISQK